MLKIIKKAAGFFILGILILPFLCPITADAYVSVRGYTKSNGTYVAPHVRSNPNGLKYDNYGYTPSQGLYNKTYGTKGAEWDTPTYITDPNYYEGKALYDAGKSGTASVSVPSAQQPAKKSVSMPSNASANSYSSQGWYCNSGYKQLGSACQKIIAPLNATVNDYASQGWYCNSGYKQSGSSCVQVVVPAHARLNDYASQGWYCDSGYKQSGNQCQQIIVPANAYLNDYSYQGWYCNSGYKQVGNSCVSN